MGMRCSLWRLDESQIAEILKNPDAFGKIVNPLPADASTDIDKTWHGIHFLLTNSAWEGDEPLCFLVFGGEFISEVSDWTRVLRPDQVAAFDEALQQISTDDLRWRYDAPQMMQEEIYPEIWDRDPKVSDPLDYLVSYFDELKRFVRRAHRNNQGLLIYIG